MYTRNQIPTMVFSMDVTPVNTYTDNEYISRRFFGVGINEVLLYAVCGDIGWWKSHLHWKAKHVSIAAFAFKIMDSMIDVSKLLDFLVVEKRKIEVR